jgi:hypothetical protein
VPSSFDLNSRIVSSSSHVGSLEVLSSVTRVDCRLATSRMRISDFLLCSAKLYVETLYSTFVASELGRPADRRGASRRTSGENLAALMVMVCAMCL